MSGKFDYKLIEEYSGMVNQIVSEYHRKYPMVEKSDIEQTLWLWFAEHPNKIRDWQKMESRKDSDKMFARSLRNAAYDLCLKEKAQKEGYSYEDVFWYRKEFVKAMIPAILSDNWKKIETALSTTGRSTKSLSESDDWMAHASDVRRAYSMLDDKEKKLIFLFYGEDIDSTELHEQVLPEKSTSRAAAMQANRALNKMVRYLGGYPPTRDKDNSYENEEILSETDSRTESGTSLHTTGEHPIEEGTVEQEQES